MRRLLSLFSFPIPKNVFLGRGTLKGGSLRGFGKNLTGLWERHTIWLVLTLFTPFSILKRIGYYSQLKKWAKWAKKWSKVVQLLSKTVKNQVFTH